MPGNLWGHLYERQLCNQGITLAKYRSIYRYEGIGPSQWSVYGDPVREGNSYVKESEHIKHKGRTASRD